MFRKVHLLFHFVVCLTRIFLIRYRNLAVLHHLIFSFYSISSSSLSSFLLNKMHTIPKFQIPLECIITVLSSSIQRGRLCVVVLCMLTLRGHPLLETVYNRGKAKGPICIATEVGNKGMSFSELYQKIVIALKNEKPLDLFHRIIES